jgi:hypothetical protein
MLMHHAQTNPAPVDTAGAATGSGRDLALEGCQWRGALFGSSWARRRTRGYPRSTPLWPSRATAEPSRGDSAAARARGAEVSALYALCCHQPQGARISSWACDILSDNRGRAWHTARSPSAHAPKWIAIPGMAVTGRRAYYFGTLPRHLHAANAHLGCQRPTAVFWSGCDLLRTPAHHTFTRAPRTAAPLTPTLGGLA